MLARICKRRHGNNWIGNRALRWVTGLLNLYDFVFLIFFCKPVDVVEGISLRASCFDGGICNVRVGCD